MAKLSRHRSKSSRLLLARMADRAILRFLAIPSGIFASFASPSKSPWTIVFCIVEEDRGKDKKRFLQEDDDRERERERIENEGFFFVFTTTYDTLEIGIFIERISNETSVDVRKFGDIDRA